MDSTMTVLQGILNNLRKKYNLVNNILNLTKDLERVLNSGDEEMFGFTLSMRQNVMNLVDKVDAENRKSVERLSEPLRGKVKQMLNPAGETLHLDNPLETDIFDTNQQILSLIKRIVSTDDTIQKKLNRQVAK